MMIGIPANPFFLNTTPKPSVNENSKFRRFGTREKRFMAQWYTPHCPHSLLHWRLSLACLEIESNNQDSCVFPMHVNTLGLVNQRSNYPL